MKGWECCRCGRINAPHVSACTCSPAPQIARVHVGSKRHIESEPLWPSTPKVTFSVDRAPLTGALGTVMARAKCLS